MTKESFEELYAINVNDKVESKPTGNNKTLKYLSWAWAWAEIKKIHPEANYEIKKFTNENGNLVPYMHDEDLGYMVVTSVTIEGLTHEMWLPVMDSNNNAMLNVAYEYSTKFGKKTVSKATMFDVNKTIMRCLTKNLAMFGLGLYIYAGEDIPEGDEQPQPLPQAPTIPDIKLEGEVLTKTEMGSYYLIPEVRDLMLKELNGRKFGELMEADQRKLTIELRDKYKELKGKDNVNN